MGRFHRTLAAGALAAVGLSLSACGTTGGFRPEYPARPMAANKSPSQAQGRAANGSGGRYHVGKPYKVGGTWYTPQEDPNYNEVGMASWYGNPYHGRKTANGEVFDMNALSAAHTTLPLPSMVEVTNLDNGRKLTVRVNDRGPFVDGRIIDLSREAASELGVIKTGTARVRVRYVGPAPLGPNITVAAAPRPAAPVAAPLPPQPEPAPMIQQVNAPAPRAIAGFEVQAGSFAMMENAEKAVGMLSSAGDLEIRPVNVNGATFYRVFIRDIADQAQADAVRERAMQAGFPGALIIPR